LGWEPAIPVEQNVDEYIQWLKTQVVRPEYLQEAERVMQESGVVQTASMT
jgi:hypothetical protein